MDSKVFDLVVNINKNNQLLYFTYKEFINVDYFRICFLLHFSYYFVPRDHDSFRIKGCFNCKLNITEMYQPI